MGAAISKILQVCFGFKPPTKDVNVMTALALVGIILVGYSGVYENGIIVALLIMIWKLFGHPMIIIAPMNIMEILIRHYHMYATFW